MIHITFGQWIKRETIDSIPILILATFPICNLIDPRSIVGQEIKETSSFAK
jgi:hypothetical protein